MDARNDGAVTPVLLNVYDLTPVNDYLYWLGFGVFHSGIEVHGMEYGFGAHDFPSSGVFEVESKSCPGFVYRRSVWLGTTDMSQEEFRSFIEKLAGKYHGNSYHLISKNCNHFTDDVCKNLTGKPIPGWVNRLARVHFLTVFYQKVSKFLLSDVSQLFVQFLMTGITNREFEELAQHGQNYLTWASDVEIVLGAKKLRAAIGLGASQNAAPTAEENDQALHFLRHHLCLTLKNEYMAEKSALALWTALKKRFEKLKYTILPRAEQEWTRLRFADYKTVGEYNSALHRICTSLQLCGKVITEAEKIEKTLSTFHPNAVQSARNYRQDGYKEYAELIDLMQVAEAQDEVLRKNYISQPPSSKVGHEVNASSYKVRKPHSKDRGKKGKVTGHKTKQNAQAKKGEQKKRDEKPYGQQDQSCYKCGTWGHWSRVCREPQHVIDAFKAKKKGKGHHEAHLAIAGMEDPQSLATPMEVDSPTPALVTPALDITAAAAVVAEEEKMDMAQIQAEVSSYFADSI